MYKIDNVLNILEDQEYEFKEISGGNPRNAIKNNVAEYATAFLNNQGGRILYGITDDRKVKGFTANASLIDEIKQAIYNSLRQIQPPLSGNHYQIEFHSVYDSNSQVIEDLYVLEVVIPPSHDRKAIYFDKGRHLHIRLDGVKHTLNGNEIISFIQGKLLES
ncbi:AlbA family DNA-binding domain-containing protein [Peribacillus simplex]|uniref:ATP-binding protein n=1 Tax=Peribacillus simplex TaxID=1478 RepID=A0AAW7IJI9_9BACI|nr:ATP-binding protein [Peribacillus simplex]MDM5455236.1 ATP-binding protein [Peribacillus simplex]